jgi:hypothetical protein
MEEVSGPMFLMYTYGDGGSCIDRYYELPVLYINVAWERIQKLTANWNTVREAEIAYYKG